MNLIIQPPPTQPIVYPMIRIHSGRFIMGSPPTEPGRYDDEEQREVEVDAFWLGATPVTQALYYAVTSKRPSHFQGDNRRPVEMVSWDDAQAFFRQLREIQPGDWRLPTEAEWEYACRAGTTTAYNTGDTLTREHACFGANEPVPVTSYPPNPWGLYDMHGNVWEWCQDEHGSARVLRGGSWIGRARHCRSARRPAHDPGHRSGFVGFRVARGPVAP